MRVLHVISSGGMYGAEAVILQLAAEMPAGKHGESFITVFSHAGQPPPDLHTIATEAGFSSELLHCQGQLDLGVLRALRDLATRLGIDVIHAHGYKADIYCSLAFRSKTRPALVSTCHTWYDNDLAVRVYGAADRWVLRQFDRVVAVSTEVQGRLLRAGVSEAKVHLIRNGVNVPPSRDASARGGEFGRARVGLVGRLAPEKGVDVFLRAVALLAQRGTEANFVIAGDGPDRSALEALRQELGIADKVSFLGQQRNMPDFYVTLDVQVSASRQEGLPMALLEGMATGLPVVATRVGQVPEVVLHNSTGFARRACVAGGSCGCDCRACLR